MHLFVISKPLNLAAITGLSSLFLVMIRMWNCLPHSCLCFIFKFVCTIWIILPLLAHAILKCLSGIFSSSQVMFIRFSHDGRRLASGSKDESVIIWNIEDVSFQYCSVSIFPFKGD